MVLGPFLLTGMITTPISLEQFVTKRWCRNLSRAELIMMRFFFVSVSYCACCVWLWRSEIEQGLQEEDEYRKPGMYMWSFNWMDCVAHCVLCTVWNLRWDSWRITWLWRWFHFGTSSHWDWSYPSGRVHIHTRTHIGNHVIGVRLRPDSLYFELDI